MAKYKDGYYIELSRHLFNDPEYKGLSVNASWLYVVLNELEHRFTSGRDDGKQWFYRSDINLAADAKMSLSTLKRAKAELKESGLIEVDYAHWVDSYGKRSEKKITAYRIL